MKKLKIVYMGTPVFALPCLEKLIEKEDVRAVITQPDRPAGRGRKVLASPVKLKAVEKGIPVYQPKSLRGSEGEDFAGKISSIRPDIIVVAAYGQILPEKILLIPPLGCINIHASLLPRWRGASPVQWSILSGDATTGISIMKMDTGLDTGPVILQRETKIFPKETGGELQERLAYLGADIFHDALDLIRDGKQEEKKQNESCSTYAPMISKKDGYMDFSCTASMLVRKIRAFQPWPGTYTFLENRLIKVLDAKVACHRSALEGQEERDSEPGTISRASSEGIDVVCGGNQIIRLLRVQPEGKKGMSASSFIAGRGNLEGMKLGKNNYRQ